MTFAVRPRRGTTRRNCSRACTACTTKIPTFQTHYNSETHETIVEGMGERHIEVAMARVARQFGVKAELSAPRIPYRETITSKGEGQGRHKKQSGGKGQFGDCWVRMRPASARLGL